MNVNIEFLLKNQLFGGNKDKDDKDDWGVKSL